MHEKNEKTPFKSLFFNLKVGSFQYGLPREAVQFRTWEVETLRKRINLLNLLWIHSLKNPNLFSEKLNNISSSNRQEFPINKEENINFNIDEEEKNEELAKKLLNLEGEILKKEALFIVKENEDENEIRRRKTLEALEKRLSLNE